MARGLARSRFISGALRRVLRAVLYGVVGMAALSLVLVVRYLNGRPDLQVWHTAELDAEFTVGSKVASFAEYRALESELFGQLERQVYDKVAGAQRDPLNRYQHGSASDPNAWATNWNRSFELVVERPRAGFLLLHGMSDSPYSLRSLALELHAAGSRVVGMRVPGHGTAPVGLTRVHWQDMAAAVALAARHLRQQVGSAPLFLVGFSNGGALSIHYALSALEDESLPRPAGLILLSPEVGITRLAGLAVWTERLGRLLGLGKLAWSTILPEYDPYKYQSFALNAAEQAHRLTDEIQSRLRRLDERLGEMPPILAFQSIVDATVTAEALVTALFDPLPRGDHELVLFDMNHFAGMDELLFTNARARMERVLNRPDRLFTMTLLTNREAGSAEVVAKTWRPGREMEVADIGITWPQEVYSLSHVALPFAADDPLYGTIESSQNPGLQIGRLLPRGERGVLRIPASDLLRMRWNPFHPYVERRLREFVAAHQGGEY